MGIDYFKGDADVDVSVSKLFDGEDGGAEFWEGEKLQSDCHRVLNPGALSREEYYGIICKIPQNLGFPHFSRISPR
jgi:hypothetical protein